MLAALFVAAACGPQSPHWEKRCVQANPLVRTPDMPDPGTAFIPVCARFDSTWVVPDTTQR